MILLDSMSSPAGVPTAIANAPYRSRRTFAGAWTPTAIMVAAAAAAAGIGWLIVLEGPQAGVAAPALLAVLLLTAKPHVGLLLFAATIPLEEALMLPGGVSFARAFGLLMAFAWCMHKLLKREGVSWIVVHPLIIASAVLLSYAVLSTLWGAYDIPSGRFLLLAQLFALAVITADVGSSWRLLDKIAKAILVGGLLCALLVILQYLQLGRGRAGGDIAGGINASARALVTALPFAFYLIASRRSEVWRFAGLAYLAAGLAAILLTFSRASLLLVIAFLPFYYFRSLRGRGRPLLLAVPIIATAMVLRFVPMDEVRERAATIVPYIESTLTRESGEISSSRGFHLRVAVAVFLDHPVVGAGYGNYGAHFLDYQWRMAGAKRIWQSRRSSHSSHLGLLADLGLVGIAFWIALWILCLRSVRMTLHGSGRLPSSAPRLLVEAIGASLVLHFLYGFSAEIHLEKLLWLLIGATVAAHRALRFDQEQGGPASFAAAGPRRVPAELRTPA